MLKNDFFYPVGYEAGKEGMIKSTLRLNRAHPIFEGHFPGFPVVPGVCMMAIIREMLEEKLDRKLVMLQAANLKFLSLINPMQNEIVEVEIKYSENEDGQLVTDGTISSGDLVFFKISRAVYR